MYFWLIKEQTKKIVENYKQKYNSSLIEDIKTNFKEDITRVLSKRLIQKQDAKN
jgi:hypothetical protein